MQTKKVRFLNPQCGFALHPIRKYLEAVFSVLKNEKKLRLQVFPYGNMAQWVRTLAAVPNYLFDPPKTHCRKRSGYLNLGPAMLNCKYAKAHTGTCVHTHKQA